MDPSSSVLLVHSSGPLRARVADALRREGFGVLVAPEPRMAEAIIRQEGPGLRAILVELALLGRGELEGTVAQEAPEAVVVRVVDFFGSDPERNLALFSVTTNSIFKPCAPESIPRELTQLLARRTAEPGGPGD